MSDLAVGEFELLVLALLRQGVDGYGVSSPPTSASGRVGTSRSAPSTRRSIRLTAKGWVLARIGEPTPERGGRRKKHFRLSAPGLRVLRQALAGLRNMTDGLEFGVQ